MRSRALASPFGGAPRRDRAPAFISARFSCSDFSLDKVTDLYVTTKYLTGQSLYRKNADARNASGNFLRLWRAATSRTPQAATRRRPGSRPRHGRRRDAARSYDPVRRTPSRQGAPGARQRGGRRHRGCRRFRSQGGKPRDVHRTLRVGENGAWQDWLLVRPEHLALVPDAIDDVVAASLPVAYLTAQGTLTLPDFTPGRTVRAPGIGGGGRG